MSLVTCSVGSLRNSSHVQLLGLSISPSTTKLHSAKGIRGVAPADRTGKSWTTYCPGGTRELLAVSRRLPRNPRDMKDIDCLLPKSLPRPECDCRRRGPPRASLYPGVSRRRHPLQPHPTAVRRTRARW